MISQIDKYYHLKSLLYSCLTNSNLRLICIPVLMGKKQFKVCRCMPCVKEQVCVSPVYRSRSVLWGAFAAAAAAEGCPHSCS